MVGGEPATCVCVCLVLSDWAAAALVVLAHTYKNGPGATGAIQHLNLLLTSVCVGLHFGRCYYNTINPPGCYPKCQQTFNAMLRFERSASLGVFRSSAIIILEQPLLLPALLDHPFYEDEG